MSHKAAWLLVLVLVAGLGAGFVFFLWQGPAPEQDIVQLPVDTAYAAPASLEVRHSVAGNTHTYRGELPTAACNTYSSGLNAVGTNPVRVSIAITIYNGSGDCATSPSQSGLQPFELSFSTEEPGEPLLDSLTINGDQVRISLIEE